MLGVVPLGEVELVVAVDRHDTAEGTTTPPVLQMLWAYCTANCWSEALHTPARQQAIVLMKLEFEQMHVMSCALHPAMEDPPPVT